MPTYISPRNLPNRKPDFDNLLKVLRCEKPNRPTLFERGVNSSLMNELTSDISYKGDPESKITQRKRRIDAFALLGYDYAMLMGTDFSFPSNDTHQGDNKTYSLNETAWIKNWGDFENYPWPNPDDIDPAPAMEEYRKKLPDNMKIMACGPGVLENAIALMGYEALCEKIYDEPELVAKVFDYINDRIFHYYKALLPFEAVGGLVLHDDWAFKTQTLLSPKHLRRFVFPGVKVIAELAHGYGKPVILHSCGNLDIVMDDLINDMKIDGRHSYEDTICPVEDFYEKWHGKISIIGGIDMDFLSTKTPDEVYKRSLAMLDRASERGGFALGSGNSITNYIPQENYLAMISAALLN